MDTTYRTSVLLVDREEMPTQVGLRLVHLIMHVVDSLDKMEETSDLETTLPHGQTLDMIPTEVGVTVIIMVNHPLLRLYLELLQCSQSENVGFVVVAGLFLMVTEE